jgi:hypothetical protein
MQIPGTFVKLLKPFEQQTMQIKKQIKKLLPATIALSLTACTIGQAVYAQDKPRLSNEAKVSRETTISTSSGGIVQSIEDTVTRYSQNVQNVQNVPPDYICDVFPQMCWF